jgi:PTH1 family peptidyl-tRNA hydrolase
VKLLVGLGNPGREYAGTRHNVGFLVVEEVARAAGFAVDRKKFAALLGEGTVAGVKAVVVEPQTYMNLSGEAVGAAARFYKVATEDVLVVHDDVDLEFGRLQIKAGGGHAGHNGLKSLIAHLGGPDFVRIRVGIGKPGGRRETVSHVLGGFDRKESEELPFVVQRAADAARCVLKDGPTKCMNEYNRREVER